MADQQVVDIVSDPVEQNDEFLEFTMDKEEVPERKRRVYRMQAPNDNQVMLLARVQSGRISEADAFLIIFEYLEDTLDRGAYNDIYRRFRRGDIALSALMDLVFAALEAFAEDRPTKPSSGSQPSGGRGRRNSTGRVQRRASQTRDDSLSDDI